MTEYRRITFTVPADMDGRPLRGVALGDMALSHHQYSSLKTHGGLLLDGAPARANTPVRPGQVVTALIPLGQDEGFIAPVSLPVDVVFEDDDIIIINKSAPLSCMSGRAGGDSLEARLLHRYGAGYVFRPVNRLDKGTSGLMAVARHPHAQQIMQKALHSCEYIRQYAALCQGLVTPERGVIDAPIAKAAGATVRRQVDPTGKPARTHYEVMQVGDGYTLLRLTLDTGRTHQIRVHMAHLGHPVVGDFLYGHEDEHLPGRLALHSQTLTLRHPISGDMLTFSADIPAEFLFPFSI